MFGLEYLAAGYMHLAAFTPKCVMREAPEISVSATGLDIRIVETMGIRDLTLMSAGKKTPFDKDAKVHTEGLRLGRIGVSGRYNYATETWKELGQVCLYVKDVTIEITLDPTIFIAKEFKPGTCHYNAVMAHEMKHVKLDRQIVNKYTNVMVKAVNNTLKHAGFVHGPYKVEQLPALQNQISGILNSVIEQFSTNMNRENDVLQRTTVDTAEEYEWVDAICNDAAKNKARENYHNPKKKK